MSVTSLLSRDSDDTIMPLVDPRNRYEGLSLAKEKALFKAVKSPKQIEWVDEDTPVDIVTASVVNLLGIGANPNILDDLGSTPMHYAALRGHQGAIEALLAANVHPDTRDTDGNTPLHYAAFQGHVACAITLIFGFAKVDAKSTSGRTPLDEARDKNHSEMIRLLTSWKV